MNRRAGLAGRFIGTHSVGWSGARRAELGAHILRVRADRRVAETAYVEFPALLRDVTPVVQPLAPAAAVADVGGSITSWNRTPYKLAQRITVRARPT
ncbi:hypothetical protein ACFYXS_35845 [Streptomyces sp. NPDC002574]|uniref:hypothetical protein n=1 Tax=Streptomyces sp. NPDC002574 TaxID=3364652 RepID=UPI0036C3A740